MPRSQTSVSKRQAIREQRLKKQRQQRLAIILGIGVVAVLLAAVIVLPGLQRANAPVGTVVPITPVARPQANGLALGDPNAPVKIQVFEDFQCPSCRRYSEEVEPQLIKNEIASGKVYYQFKHYPFLDSRSVAKESHQAANASMCANDQGRFWDYHDMLFTNWNGENQGSFSDKRLVAFAQFLGLDMDKFNTCFKANTFKDTIQQDFNEGTRLGVTGTPSVFVNGKIVAPGLIPTYDQIKQAINAAAPSQ